METVTTKRNTWVACPKCGHKVARVRTCDMELKCKQCGHEFEVVINSSRASMVREDAEPYGAQAKRS